MSEPPLHVREVLDISDDISAIIAEDSFHLSTFMLDIIFSLIAAALYFSSATCFHYIEKTFIITSFSRLRYLFSSRPPRVSFIGFHSLAALNIWAFYFYFFQRMLSFFRCSYISSDIFISLYFLIYVSLISLLSSYCRCRGQPRPPRPSHHCLHIMPAPHTHHELQMRSRYFI